MKKYAYLILFSLCAFSANTAFADPFNLKFTSTVDPTFGLNTDLPPGVAINELFIIDLIVDNGGDNANSQTWTEAHILSITIRVGKSYSFVLPRSILSDLAGDGGTITTNAAGNVAGMNASWLTSISAGTPDTNGTDGYLLNISGGGATTVLVLFDAAGEFGVGDRIIPTEDTHTVANWQVMNLDVSYQNNNINAPLFDRPMATCSITQFNNIPYHVQQFSVSSAGSYTMHSNQNFDGYLHLYSNYFDSANPLTNCDEGDDNDGSHQSELTVSLTPDTAYYLVTSGFRSANTGTFTNTFSGPGSITLGGAASGDCDGNNEINIQDVICTINKILGP